MAFSRRSLLQYTPAALAGLTLPLRNALANGKGNDLKFVFVVNYGGWGPTRVFATEFDNPNVDMESTAQEGTFGNLRFVDHEDRPSVRNFLEYYYQKILFVNGILVPSVAHLNCLRLMLTGTTNNNSSDWPAMIAAKTAADYPLPHIVLEGPSYSGSLGGVVSRTGSSGQLEGLLNGEIIDWSDVATQGPSERAEDIMDRYLERRALAVQGNAKLERELEFANSFATSHGTAQSLKGLVGVTDFGSGTNFSAQIRLAVDTLSLGVSRCATIAYTGDIWDTHTNNDRDQSSNFEELFVGLQDLMNRLDTTFGHSTPYLSGETVVMVLSEMGRTPQLNESNGKDHWPYTSAMLIGPGLTTNRVVGGLDSYYYGELIDLASGELDPNGADLSSASLGATLLNLADIEHGDYMPGVASIPGLLG
jgi:hypothetical protein